MKWWTASTTRCCTTLLLPDDYHRHNELIEHVKAANNEDLCKPSPESQ